MPLSDRQVRWQTRHIHHRVTLKICGGVVDVKIKMAATPSSLTPTLLLAPSCSYTLYYNSTLTHTHTLSTSRGYTAELPTANVCTVAHSYTTAYTHTLFLLCWNTSGFRWMVVNGFEQFSISLALYITVKYSSTLKCGLEVRQWNVTASVVVSGCLSSCPARVDILIKGHCGGQLSQETYPVSQNLNNSLL